MCALLALQHKLSKTLQNMITSWAPTSHKLKKKKVELSLDFHTAMCTSSDLLSTVCIAIIKNNDLNSTSKRYKTSIVSICFSNAKSINPFYSKVK